MRRVGGEDAIGELMLRLSGSECGTRCTRVQPSVEVLVGPGMAASLWRFKVGSFDVGFEL